MLYKMLFRTFPFETEEDELLPSREKCTRLMEVQPVTIHLKSLEFNV